MANKVPDSDEAVVELLSKAGIRRPAIDAVLKIDALVQNWRRGINRHDPGKIALDDLKVGLELAQFDVLVAIAAPDSEFGDTVADETMVLTVAERLRIDPSRASRIIADMVEAGYVRRAVSQGDARRTIVQLTERGAAVVAAVRAHKLLMRADLLAEWSDADIEAFIPLFARFTTWTESMEQRRTRHAAELAHLLAEIPD